MPSRTVKWVYCPRSIPSQNDVFSTDSIDVLRNNILTELEQECHALTRGQRCADWFLLRKFRITATIAAKVLIHDNGIRNELGLPVPADTATQVSQAQWMEQLCEGWFSQRKSIEAMKRGSCNEDSVHKALVEMDFVERIYDIGLMALKYNAGLACSANGIALLDMS